MQHPIIFGVFASPWTTLKTEKENLHFYGKWSVSLDTLRGAWRDQPWAILLIFKRNRPWKPEDRLCTLFFIEMWKESLEKAKEHHQFVASLGAGSKQLHVQGF